MDNVICVSRFMKEYTLENYPDLKNVKVWYPGVSFKLFENIPVKEDHNIEVGTKVILTVSRVVKGEGFDQGNV